MAGLRKGRCYREIERAYTRKSKFRSKGFVKAIPPNKIIKYNMGNAKKEFPAKITLVSKESVQIRNNSMESARQVVN